MEQALASPIGCAPLREGLTPGASVCIVFTDITRATPNHRIIPWLLDWLGAAGVEREAITLLNSTGTHRGNTQQELEGMLTPEVVRGYRVINHDCHAQEEMVEFGETRGGAKALISRRARVLLYSSLTPDLVEATLLASCSDIGAAVQQELDALGGQGRVAVLPQGPLTIPYIG